MPGENDKKMTVLQKLDARKEEREKKKKTDHVALNVLVDRFTAEYNQKCKRIEAQISQLETAQPSQREALFLDIKEGINAAQKFLADNSGMLPAYDMAFNKERISKLSEKFQEKQDQLGEKKKFKLRRAPKSDKPGKGKKVSDTKSTVIIPTKQEGVALEGGTDGGMSLADETGKEFTLKSKDVNLKDVNMSNLTNCTVHLYGSPSTVHLNNISRCKLYLGPVQTSIFMDKCVDSEFHIACQQLRAHNSTNCRIYIHVTSRSIIEDCTGMQFAPYDFTYSGIDEDYKLSTLSKEINNWKSVDDFNWLASNEQSPNWNIMKKK